jgi:hypothetical protein
MLGKIRSIARKNNYVIYQRPFQLNIWGIRSPQTRSGQFDDHIHVFYKTGALKWDYHIFRATTDPGTYWLGNPMMPQGTAILAQGQMVDAYTIGLHKGQYAALIQSKSVTVIRDYNRDSTLDFFNGRFHRGYFGINIHRAMQQGITPYIEKFSAGCQVFENASDFYRFIIMCEKHRSLYGNRFTYTLVDERAMKRATLRRTIYGTAAIGAVAAGTLYLLNNHQKEKQLTI